ncbi:hypothetical protein FKM82_029899 [Ascaphus truei]
MTLQRHYSSNKATSDQISHNEAIDITVDQMAIIEDLEALLKESDPDFVNFGSYTHTGFKPNSVFFPYASRGNNIEYLENLLNRISEICVRKTIDYISNLIWDEQKMFKQLKSNPDIVLRSADRGGG